MQNGKLGNNAIATGTADAIVLNYSPIPASESDLLIILFRAIGSNTITNPTVNANGMGAKTIYKNGGNALEIGDIPGADAVCILQLDVPNDRWELLNPSYQNQIGTINGTGLFIFITNGDETTTSASATAITDLITPTLEANSRYIIEGFIHFGCNNTGGVLFAVDIPAGSSIYGNWFSRTTINTDIITQPTTADATLTVTAFNRVNSPVGGMHFYFEVETDATTDFIQLMFASATGGQTSTIYQLGSWFFIKKIA